jgi:hypothetical protein
MCVVGHSVFRERILSGGDHELPYFLTNNVFAGFRIVGEPVRVSRCIADIIRPGKIDGTKEISVLDECKNSVRPG